jgi:poly-beta-1,6-N-acetyl-D-glucosamine biosynthesis protein PgaD
VALWALWVYWILPVVTIFLWLAGVRFLYYKIFLGRGLLQLLSILRDGGLAILAIFVLNLVWVNYNYYLIFKRLGERRKQVGQCSDKMVAEFFKMDTQTLEKAKRRRSIKLALTEEGFIVTDELN